jgi:hypothetical protein
MAAILEDNIPEELFHEANLSPAVLLAWFLEFANPNGRVHLPLAEEQLAKLRQAHHSILEGRGGLSSGRYLRIIDDKMRSRTFHARDQAQEIFCPSQGQPLKLVSLLPSRAYHPDKFSNLRTRIPSSKRKSQYQR